ncbi:MAG: hypothetical protein M1823_008144, partial [Watsoniomyces obsoletus]
RRTCRRHLVRRSKDSYNAGRQVGFEDSNACRAGACRHSCRSSRRPHHRRHLPDCWSTDLHCYTICYGRVDLGKLCSGTLKSSSMGGPFWLHRHCDWTNHSPLYGRCIRQWEEWLFRRRRRIPRDIQQPSYRLVELGHHGVHRRIQLFWT